MLTCYDHPTACLEDAAGIDVILVGDSVGTNVLGYASVDQVTMDDMCHHVAAVSRGVRAAFLLADMPFRSYETHAEAVANARRLLSAGAGGVKIEGGREQLPVIEALRAGGIDVCGHLGYTPQTLGPRPVPVGRSREEAGRLLADAGALDDAGVCMLVLELVPEELSGRVTAHVSCPVIGIGAGRLTDGEVQVVNDILGMTERVFRHTRPWMAWRGLARAAIASYAAAVREGAFPEDGNVTHMDAGAAGASGVEGCDAR